jgi:hypothetical protein
MVIVLDVLAPSNARTIRRQPSRESWLIAVIVELAGEIA